MKQHGPDATAPARSRPAPGGSCPLAVVVDLSQHEALACDKDAAGQSVGPAGQLGAPLLAQSSYAASMHVNNVMTGRLTYVPDRRRAPAVIAG